MLHERLKQVAKYLIGQGVAKNQEKLGELLGYTNKASFSHILNNRKPLPVDFIDKLVSLDKKVNKVWIITGEGEMLKDSSPLMVISKRPSYTLRQFMEDYMSHVKLSTIDSEFLDYDVSDLKDDDIEDFAKIIGHDPKDLQYGIDMVVSSGSKGKLVPVIDTRAAAGQGSVELSGHREGWINVGDLLKDSEMALYVYGNSMIPGYPPGSLLGLQRRYDSFIEPGSVYVVETLSSRYVKRLYYNKDKTSFLCLSDNHIKHTDGPIEGEYIYPPFEIPLKEVSIIWDVTGVIKRNKALML